MIQNLILIGLGGFFGSIARYLIALLVQSSGSTGFPLGTLVVNVVGCFSMGVVATLAEKNLGVSSPIYLFISVGLIGGFATFSAFGLETVVLVREQHLGMASLYIFSSLALGIGAIFLGKWIC